MRANNDKVLRTLVKDALDASPSAEAARRMNAAIQRELDRQAVPHQDILTFDEVAAYLRVPADTLQDYLDELPCFELGGQLLFRKEAVVEWIDQREQRYRAELNHYSAGEPKVYSIV